MRKVIENGYIIALTTGNVGVEITEAEYNTILDLVHSKSTAPEGYDYLLTAELTRELVEISPMLEDDEEATAEDYENALGRFGA